MEQGLKLTVLNEEETTVIVLDGRLDTNTSQQLDKEDKMLQAEGIDDIIVDMTDCAFVSSAGLRVIISMQKRVAQNGSLVFRNVCPDVMDVFKMTGFENILTFE